MKKNKKTNSTSCTILLSLFTWITSVLISVFVSLFVVQFYVLGSLNIQHIAKGAANTQFVKSAHCKSLEQQLRLLLNVKGTEKSLQNMGYDPALDTCVAVHIVEIKDQSGTTAKTLMIAEDFLRGNVLGQKEVTLKPETTAAIAQ